MKILQLFNLLIFTCLLNFCLFGQQNDSVIQTTNKEKIIRDLDSMEKDVFYKQRMIDSLRVYTGVNTQDTFKLLDTFKKSIESKPEGKKMGRRERCIIFGYETFVGLNHGVFDYCMEKSDEEYYHNLLKFFGNLYCEEHKHENTLIDKKIEKYFLELGIIKPTPK